MPPRLELDHLQTEAPALLQTTVSHRLPHLSAAVLACHCQQLFAVQKLTPAQTCPSRLQPPLSSAVQVGFLARSTAALLASGTTSEFLGAAGLAPYLDLSAACTALVAAQAPAVQAAS